MFATAQGSLSRHAQCSHPRLLAHYSFPARGGRGNFENTDGGAGAGNRSLPRLGAAPLQLPPPPPARDRALEQPPTLEAPGPERPRERRPSDAPAGPWPQAGHGARAAPSPPQSRRVGSRKGHFSVDLQKSHGTAKGRGSPAEPGPLPGHLARVHLKAPRPQRARAAPRPPPPRAASEAGRGTDLPGAEPARGRRAGLR